MFEDTFSPDAPPTADELVKASAIDLDVEDGSTVPFGSLISDSGKTVVVFVRHFHCSMCQDYVTQLGSIREEALDAANVSLIVIGCGDRSVIPEYRERTEYRYPIYANPRKELYVALGMTRRTFHAAPPGEAPKSYIRAGKWAYAIRGIMKGPLSHPVSYIKAGDNQQLGGEIIFEPGPQCTFVARMKHTADHTEVKDLMEKAGVEYP
ncbi:hypothetical protein DACRYDRAFT_106600 [Dacryopinax primogenitus]|uniref:AhpC-TSA-domain-containing protein n=1 Tax=Dacryopinax primogenitus (strain DJM 731) TaxID=1858805 RepID=M5G1C3_DACPD|nr:uncharacterized protein DACRYDRAFT_106600 [Dacryopinax primogenitus]EJU02529.1 hypothetical protein DACRYDRAFT_106600 [Dacryopinax primogenitus]